MRAIYRRCETRGRVRIAGIPRVRDETERQDDSARVCACMRQRVWMRVCVCNQTRGGGVGGGGTGRGVVSVLGPNVCLCVLARSRALTREYL